MQGRLRNGLDFIRTQSPWARQGSQERVPNLQEAPEPISNTKKKKNQMKHLSCHGILPTGWSSRNHEPRGQWVQDAADRGSSAEHTENSWNSTASKHATWLKHGQKSFRHCTKQAESTTRCHHFFLMWLKPNTEHQTWVRLKAARLAVGCGNMVYAATLRDNQVFILVLLKLELTGSGMLDQGSN